MPIVSTKVMSSIVLHTGANQACSNVEIIRRASVEFASAMAILIVRMAQMNPSVTQTVESTASSAKRLGAVCPTLGNAMVRNRRLLFL